MTVRHRGGARRARAAVSERASRWRTVAKRGRASSSSVAPTSSAPERGAPPQGFTTTTSLWSHSILQLRGARGSNTRPVGGRARALSGRRPVIGRLAPQCVVRGWRSYHKVSPQPQGCGPILFLRSGDPTPRGSNAGRGRGGSRPARAGILAAASFFEAGSRSVPNGLVRTCEK